MVVGDGCFVANCGRVVDGGCGGVGASDEGDGDLVGWILMVVLMVLVVRVIIKMKLLVMVLLVEVMVVGIVIMGVWRV